jgi:hypothetical protein
MRANGGGNEYHRTVSAGSRAAAARPADSGGVLTVRSGLARCKLGAGIAAAALWLTIAAGPAAAQNVSDLARDLNPLFQRIVASPSDLDNTVNYGAAAAKAGDIESAIGTYEQLLFYNPHLSRVRFELGVLYFRLGSYEMARGYFKSALRMRDMSPELRDNTEQFLEAIDRKMQPDQLSGFAQTGVRAQSNASLGPSPQVLLASQQLFDSRFFARPDWNWFGTFGVNYVHDFGNQRGDTFEASVLGYDAQQFTLHQFDIGLLEVRTGPRFGLTTDGPNGITVKPYVVATGAALADAPYASGIGGGGTVHIPVGRVAVDPFVEVVQQNFRSSSLYPLAGLLSGTLSTYGVLAAAPIYGGLSWHARFAYDHDEAVFAPYAYDRYSADIWLPLNFSPPWDSHTWTLTPGAGFSQWIYHAPDPNIDPLQAQRTQEWRVSLGLDMPVRKQLYLSMLGQYHGFASNIPVFTMTDWSFTAGPMLKF